MTKIKFIVTTTKNGIIYSSNIVIAENIKAVRDHYGETLVKAKPAVPYELEEYERKGMPTVEI